MNSLFAFLCLLFIVAAQSPAQAQFLDVQIVDVTNTLVHVDLHELQKQTFTQNLNLDPIVVTDLSGNKVTVSRENIGYALTRKPNPIYLGQARLIGEELTFTDIRFGGEATNHYLELAPEKPGVTTPLALQGNRLTTQTFCGFFGYLMTGYQNGGKWKSEKAYPDHVKSVYFNLINLSWPGVFSGFSSNARRARVRAPVDATHIATEIRCSTHMFY